MSAGVVPLARPDSKLLNVFKKMEPLYTCEYYLYNVSHLAAIIRNVRLQDKTMPYYLPS
jgi:hypothetical protein